MYVCMFVLSDFLVVELDGWDRSGLDECRLRLDSIDLWLWFVGYKIGFLCIFIGIKSLY